MLAMAKPNRRASEKLLLDSGTTSHMSPSIHKVRYRSECDVPIPLSDDSTVVTNERGTRSVRSATEQGMVNVYFIETLVAKDITMSLNSVAALVRKLICVIFVPGKSRLVDNENGYHIVGTEAERVTGCSTYQTTRGDRRSLGRIKLVVPRSRDGFCK